MAKGNRPVHEVRVGLIKAAIWRNERKDGDRKFTLYSTSLQRSYKDEKGDWQTTSESWRPEDLPVLEKVAAKACDWILSQQGLPDELRDEAESSAA